MPPEPAGGTTLPARRLFSIIKELPADEIDISVDEKNAATIRCGPSHFKIMGLGDLVVRTLAEYAPDLPRLIVARQVITPADLESEFGFTGGHVHHGEMALDQVFAMRPLLGWAQYRTPIKNLYLCGSATHPGGGIMGAPGRNAAMRMLKDVRK